MNEHKNILEPAYFFRPLMILRFLLLTFFFQTWAYPQISPQKFNDYADKYFNLYKVPALGAGLQMPDSARWTAYRGYSDLEYRIPAGAKSLFRIASISKLITSVAIMQLVEAGEIKLDDDIRKYLPEFPRKKYIFTIRQILNHTSGLRTYRDKEFDLTIYFDSSIDAVNYIAKDSLVFRPGTKYLYSTLSYNLLAALIEKVSGKPFVDYINEKIFLPAEMHSAVFDVQRSLIPNRAKGYTKNAAREFENAALADLSIKYAGGGMLCTLEDLLNFGSALLNNRLISSASLDSVLKPSKQNPTYGLGVTIHYANNEILYFGHSGAGTGFVSNLLIHPKKKIVAAHLVNLRDRNIADAAKDLLVLAIGDSSLTLPDFLLDDSLHTIYRTVGIKNVINFLDSLKLNDSVALICNLPEILDFTRDLVSLHKKESALKVLAHLNILIANNSAILTELGKTYIKDQNIGLGLKYLKLAYEKSNDPNLRKFILEQEKMNKRRSK